MAVTMAVLVARRSTQHYHQSRYCQEMLGRPSAPQPSALGQSHRWRTLLCPRPLPACLVLLLSP